jgi:hypothetical protein
MGVLPTSSLTTKSCGTEPEHRGLHAKHCRSDGSGVLFPDAVPESRRELRPAQTTVTRMPERASTAEPDGLVARTVIAWRSER